MRRVFIGLSLCVFCLPLWAMPLKPQRVTLASGRAFSVRLLANYRILPVAQGLMRPRFFALASDGRVFVTQMHDKSDNAQGAVTILDGFDAETGRFTKISNYLSHLRNPNNLAFWRDSKTSKTWLYVAMTDHLVRYEFQNGDQKPRGNPQTIATFPAYGLSYKYGGWHLTRTVAPSKDKIYVSVGSSGDALIEKEKVRATVLEMNPDGTGQKIWARGLRNAVGLKWIGDTLYATNQGGDKLGDNRPNETFYALRPDTNYGWPFAFQSAGKIERDSRFKPPIGFKNGPLANAAFPAHSSALGFDWFDTASSAALRNHFLVALHGSGFTRLKRGYSLVTVQKNGAISPFLSGFLQRGHIFGRPCDVMKWKNGFLMSDDYKGVIYYIASG